MNQHLAWGAPEYQLKRSQWVPGDIDEVFRFFEDPANLAKITPPWLGFRIIAMEPDRIEQGTRIEYRVKWFGFSYRWVTLIDEWRPVTSFIDSQANGPYIQWRHRHTFEAINGGVKISDEVAYRLPFGILGSVMHRLVVRRQLEQVFDFRRAAVARLLSNGIEHVTVPRAPSAKMKWHRISNIRHFGGLGQ